MSTSYSLPDSRLDAIAVVQGAWKYSDPGRLLAERVGSPAAHTMLSPNGGNTPQSLVNALARRITAGELDVAVVVGAESIWTRRRMRRAGIRIPITEQVGVEPDERFGQEVQMSSRHESERGFDQREVEGVVSGISGRDAGRMAYAWTGRSDQIPNRRSSMKRTPPGRPARGGFEVSIWAAFFWWISAIGFRDLSRIS